MSKKANLLWTTFKQRMGVSEFSGTSYNLGDLLVSHDLEGLDADVSQDEIELVINCLPNIHAPRPDGFNGMFVKKCWDFVKDDFIRMFRDFCSHNIDLRSINSSFIALIPKKENPETVNDYRSISL
jgi:hypothetical protein